MEQQNRTTEKLTDKAFLRLVVTSILGIIVCIVCLCSTSYAWFTAGVPSEKNELRAAGECKLEVTVSPEGGTAIDGIENGVELEAGEYIVALLLPADSPSGYCVIEAGGTTYYSDYIVSHKEPAPQIKAFKLKVETTQVVTFTVRWGIYTRDSDVIGGILTVAGGSALAETGAPADETNVPADETNVPADETTEPSVETEAPSETN